MTEKTTEKKGGKKKTRGAKRSDGRPARARYWLSQRLMLRKVRALVCAGFTLEAAQEAWKLRGRCKRNAADFVPTAALRQFTRLAEKVKARRQANRVRAMRRWEAREKARGV